MKIISAKSIGYRRTYNLEMAGDQHNYITDSSSAVHANSHAVSYCLMAYRCFWLKKHFAPEFWAAVMSDCHPDKLVRFMSTARSEKWAPTAITHIGRSTDDGLRFGTLNIENLTAKCTVTGNVVNQGMNGIKGIGDKAAEVFAGVGQFSSIEQFLEGEGRKNKIVMERFIKLGVFQHLPGHQNSKALWYWYRYAHCNEKSEFKNEIKQRLLERQGWNEKTISEEIQRQASQYKILYPKRNKIPTKITNWKPKPDDSRQQVMSLVSDDFTLAEKLEFQMQFLGYYLDSPMELFEIEGDRDIATAKSHGDCTVVLEVMISDIEFHQTKPNPGRPSSTYARVTVTDGVQNALVMIWSGELSRQDPEIFRAGSGVKIMAYHESSRGVFVMARGTNIVQLRRR